MKKDEVVLLLADHNLMWEDFLYFMDDKTLEIKDYQILFPKKYVYEFIDTNTYNKENNYD